MPKVFGLSHILYIVISYTLMFTGWILIKKFVKSKITLRRIFFVLGIVQIALILWCRISTEKGNLNPIILLPYTFCATTSFVFGFILMFGKQNTKPLQFITMCAFVGGGIVSFYPDFLGQASTIFYSSTFSGLLHHSMLVFNSVLVLITGYLKPDFKKWASLPIGLSIYMVYGIFQITVIGRENAMYILGSLIERTPLTWSLVGTIFLILYTLFLIIYEHFTLSIENRFLTKFMAYVKSKKFFDRFYFFKRKNKIDKVEDKLKVKE